MEHWLRTKGGGSAESCGFAVKTRRISLEFRLGRLTRLFTEVMEVPHAGEKARRFEGDTTGETSAIPIR